MAELVYSAGLTSKLFWLHESRKTAGYILAGWTDKHDFPMQAGCMMRRKCVHL